MGADVHLHSVQTHPDEPRDVPFSATASLPSSLDFLADVSTHQARTGPDTNPMLVVDQQTYSEVPPVYQQPYRDPMFYPMPNETLQLWLNPSDAASYPASLDLGQGSNFGLTRESVGVSPMQRPQQQSRPSIDSAKTSAAIPSERFAKVQCYWLSPTNNTGRLMNGLWQDVAYSDLDNIFAHHTGPPPGFMPVSLQGSRYGLDEDCRRRLHATFGYMRLYNQQPRSSENAPPTYDSALIALPNFPPAEILDMALDVYFRSFHPLVPFIHLPTFSAKNIDLSVLYVMCLIGMTLLGTQGTASFVSKNFTVRLNLRKPRQFYHILIFLTTSLSLKSSRPSWPNAPLALKVQQSLCLPLRPPFSF
jgi:hypothetical protein